MRERAVDVLRRHPAVIAALVAVVARIPGVTRPIRPDEAGFLMVARAWDPRPDSMFGPYWVDRPPSLIAVYRAVDALGGETTTLRLLGAGVVGVTVLLAAAATRLAAPDPRAAAWAAVGAAALLSNPMIDVVAVKGELLALPFLLGAVALALLAVRRHAASLAVPTALAAGLSAGLAIGLKQNLVGGLVFGAVLLAAAWRAGEVPGGSAARLAAAGLAGAALPVVATLAWTEAAGVRLATLWETVYGFRAEAARVIADGTTDAPERRAWILLVIAIATGLLPIVGGLFAHLRELWSTDPPVVAAILALVVSDVLVLAGGGSFWQDYLTPLVPGAAMCVGLLACRPARPGRIMRGVVVGATVSAVLAMAYWLVFNAAGRQEFDEVRTGRAVAEAAEPADTIVVFGGRADLVHASGLTSPYPYLWSLPMRGRDPGYAELRALLESPSAPTWLVEWVDFDAWSADGVLELERAVAEHYARRGTTCKGQPIYLLRGVARPEPTAECR